MPTVATRSRQTRRRVENQTPNVLIKITDEMILKREVMAYEDGYADAREYGKAGYYMTEEYTSAQRMAYLEGFRKGLRVFNIRYKDARQNQERRSG